MIKTLLGLAMVALLASAQVKKSTVEGVTNFAQVETTVACAGATTPDALAGIKKMGYASVINLRLPTEQNANLEAEAAAARVANITYIHLPFDGSKPDPAVADRFIQIVTTPANQPAFIHCASGNRAAALWMIKRVLIDKWDTDRASEEATQLGLTSSALKTFALDYIQSHRK
jgi:uncharacterized protein (TIGR01244 family)